MTVLILLIILDLIVIGVVIYFVWAEKEKHTEHYIQQSTSQREDESPTSNISAASARPAVTDSDVEEVTITEAFEAQAEGLTTEAKERRDWAVQTMDDSEAAAESAADDETSEAPKKDE